MTRKEKGLAFALLVATTAGFLAFNPFQQAKPVFGIEHATLKNGMNVYVVENHNVPAVTHMVWYKVGAADDPQGMSGMAHYLEHLMFKGTPDVADGEFSKRIQSWGGNDNAFTSYDYTAYFQTVPAEKLSTVMAMEADRMQHLTPAATPARTELNVVINERKERTDNDPAAKLGEKINAMLYKGHPYARPVIGPMQELEKLTLAEAKQFYAANYTHENAYVVVAGDTTLQDVLQNAEKTYGAIASNKQPLNRNRKMPEHLKQDVSITHNDPSVAQPLLVRSVLVPSFRLHPQKARALSVLAEILSGSTGPLYQELVVKQQLATQVDIDYDATAYDVSSFDIVVLPNTNVSLETLQTALKDLLSKLTLSELEMQQALTRMQDRAVFERDSLAGPAMVVGLKLAAGMTAQHIDTWPHSLQKTKKAEVEAALQTLRGEPAVYGNLMP